jgi:hypothetical protein
MRNHKRQRSTSGAIEFAALEVEDDPGIVRSRRIRFSVPDADLDGARICLGHEELLADADTLEIDLPRASVSGPPTSGRAAAPLDQPAGWRQWLRYVWPG